MISRRIALAAVALTSCLSLVQPATAAPATPDLGRAVRQSAHVATAQSARDAARTARTNRGKKPVRTDRETVRVLEASLDQLVADGAIGVTARVDSPKVHWSGAAGLRDKDGRSPAHSQDRFRAASNTKMMVATLVLQEVQRGHWSLDTTVDEVVPGLLPQHGDVTIKQLLSHTSGMPSGTNELLLANMTDYESYEQMLAAIGKDYTPQDMVDAVNAGTWTTPGEFMYSNGGYVTLGMLLEAETGRPLAELLRDRIWRPAGMKHTSYPDEPGYRGPSLHEDGWLGAEGWLELDGFDPDFFGASGAVITTTEDLSAFTRALMAGKLVDKSLLAQMMTPVSTTPIEYGLGLYRIPDACPSNPADPYLYGHDGAAFGTLSVVFTSPDGTRQVTLAGTGRDYSSPVPRWLLDTALVPMLEASCQK